MRKLLRGTWKEILSRDTVIRAMINWRVEGFKYPRLFIDPIAESGLFDIVSLIAFQFGVEFHFSQCNFVIDRAA